MNKPPDPDPLTICSSPPSPADFVNVTDMPLSDSSASSINNSNKSKKFKRMKKSINNSDSNSYTLNLNSDKSSVQKLPSTSLPSSQIISESQSSSQSQSSSRQFYKKSDLGPFVVIVQKTDFSPNASAAIHPLSFGRFLFQNNIKNIVSGSIKRLGRNKISLQFISAEDANNFLSVPTIFKNGYKSYIPSYSVCRLGLVRGIPSDWSEEEILNNISIPSNCGSVLKVRRLNYKVSCNGGVEWRPSSSVVFTFDGQVLPKRINICFNSLEVLTYIYPTIQCRKCCRYGHTMAHCRSGPRCFRCGESHLGLSCSVEENEAFCVMCSGSHFANSLMCPELSRQRNIKSTMAERSISYNEASNLFPKSTKPFSEVVKSGFSQLSSSQPLTQTHLSSYKKTIHKKPNQPPLPRFGYDVSAHRDIIRTPTLPKSHPFINKRSNHDESDVPVVELISSLISILSSSSNLPSNVAPLLSSLISLLNNGQFQLQNNTMELSQHQTKKT